MNWLAELKVGDRVIVTNGRWPFLDWITRVDGYYVWTSQLKFSALDGACAGDPKWHLETRTEETLDVFEVDNLAETIHLIHRDELAQLPLDTLRAAHSLLCGEPDLTREGSA